MARINEPIQLIENVGAGLRFIISPAVGRTWCDWHIEHTNVTLAQMTNIEVKLVSPLKTVTLQKFKDGTELDEMNKRYGRKTAAGTLSFYLRKPEMENEAQSMATALGTGGLMGVRIEGDIAGAAVNPSLAAWGKKTTNRSVAAGILPYIVDSNHGGQAQGDNYFDAIEKRDRIAAIHVLNDDVDKLTLKVDDGVVHELTRARAEFAEQAGNRVSYAAGYGQVIDFTLAGVLDEALVMQGTGYQAQQMRLTAALGAGASATTRILVEYLTTWASLAGGNTQRAA